MKNFTGTIIEESLENTDVLQKVQNETGVSSRLLVSILAVEQLRLFYSERESFKKFLILLYPDSDNYQHKPKKMPTIKQKLYKDQFSI